MLITLLHIPDWGQSKTAEKLESQGSITQIMTSLHIVHLNSKLRYYYD